MNCPNCHLNMHYMGPAFRPEHTSHLSFFLMPSVIPCPLQGPAGCLWQQRRQGVWQQGFLCQPGALLRRLECATRRGRTLVQQALSTAAWGCLPLQPAYLQQLARLHKSVWGTAIERSWCGMQLARFQGSGPWPLRGGAWRCCGAEAAVLQNATWARKAGCATAEPASSDSSGREL